MTQTMAPTRARSTHHALPLYLAAAVLCLAALASLTQLLAEPQRTAFTIRNDTKWDLTVAVQDRDGTVTVATVDAGTTRSVREVIVPSGPWEIQWRSGGTPLAVSPVPHDAVGQGFQVEVPQAVEDALAAAGVPASP